MRFRPLVADALANAFALGPWEPAELRQLGAEVLGVRHPWLAPLVRAILTHFPAPPGADEDVASIAAFIEAHPKFQAAFFAEEVPRIRRWLSRPPSMGIMPWSVPPATTVAELGQLLEVDPRELEWLADTRRYLLRAKSPWLGHYHRTWLPKARGGHRLIEIPKPRIKVVQRRVLRRILDAIPAHECAEGFVRGRSALTHASKHVASAALLCLDLEDFFTSIRYGRVFRVFRAAGYPLPVARALAGLCTTALPSAELASVPRPVLGSDVERTHRLRCNALRQHLPQGAPTSPALANLCAYSLDRRLSGAASGAGIRYSRYADDLAFSGGDEFARGTGSFASLAAGIAMDEGFNVNFRKTRVMRRAARQQVCGVVVNVHTNVARREYDRLKAILTNCLRRGVTGQNREGHADFRGHLQGRVAWVAALSPARGAKLLELADAIDWTAPSGSVVDEPSV
jgi:RNA-directed DNA polymerase